MLGKRKKEESGRARGNRYRLLFSQLIYRNPDLTDGPYPNKTINSPLRYDNFNCQTYSLHCSLAPIICVH